MPFDGLKASSPKQCRHLNGRYQVQVLRLVPGHPIAPEHAPKDTLRIGDLDEEKATRPKHLMRSLQLGALVRDMLHVVSHADHIESSSQVGSLRREEALVSLIHPATSLSNGDRFTKVKTLQPCP